MATRARGGRRLGGSPRRLLANTSPGCCELVSGLVLRRIGIPRFVAKRGEDPVPRP
ncbi:hypothetical protein CASFOL_012263 [Castilleja foliolosa]|uniref:Uncharacterized protein n=1 Tax=Castilleja foliolosa TaxID=1961234 RepID=A0ABD3DPW4_9LAMI